MKKSLFLMLLILCVGCGKESGNSTAKVIGSHIVGGEKIKENNLYSRYTVGLLNTKKQTICTGSIIEKDLILTAAHCVDNASPKDIEVNFGFTIGGTNSIKYKAHSLYLHEKYVHTKELLDNDIAIIRLAKAVPAPYLPLDLEESRTLSLQKGDKITALGYGKIRTGLFTGKGTLRSATISIEEFAIDSQLITLNQKEGTGVCFGDSGGPSFTLKNGKPVLVGVTSYVTAEEGKNSDCKQNSGLSNPNYFYNWIMESKLLVPSV